MKLYRDESSLHDLLSGRRRDVGASLARGGLTVAEWGYSAAVSLRNCAYDRGWLTVARAGVPVVSLGNITTGGTGKTPTAAWLANWLVAAGHRPGLLSRGYRVLKHDGGGAAGVCPLPEGNDEKRVLDRLCPGVPHLQQRDRVESSRRLVHDFGCDVLILDDGFQHRRLHRDLDLVLIDALQPWGFGHVLPRGLLREPKRGLRRASLVAITRADQAPEAGRQRLRTELQRLCGTADCVEIAFKPQSLRGLDGEIHPLDLPAGRRVLAFCGIGNPGAFHQAAASLAKETEFRAFPDHYHYQVADLIDLSKLAGACRADIVLTTLKDLVKIEPGTWQGPPLYAVEIGLEFLSGQDLLTAQLQRLLTPGTY